MSEIAMKERKGSGRKAAVDQEQVEVITAKEAIGIDAALRSDVAVAESAVQQEQAHREALRPTDEYFGLAEPYDFGRSISEVRVRLERSAEDLLVAGRHLLLIKEHEPHGRFTTALEELHVPPATARRIMAATLRFWRPELKPLLQLGRSKLYELMTLDDDELEGLATGQPLLQLDLELDEIDRMTTTELRSRLRKAEVEHKAECDAKDKLIKAKNERLDELRQQLARRAAMPEAERAAELEQGLNEAVTSVVGSVLSLVGPLRAIEDGFERVPDGLLAACGGALSRVLAELDSVARQFGLSLQMPFDGMDIDGMDDQVG